MLFCWVLRGSGEHSSQGWGQLRVFSRIIFVAVMVGATVLTSTPAGAAVPAGIRIDRFVDPSGQGIFLVGANYEGPADRAWKMWDEGKFDATLIGRDLDRARAAGLSVLRVFVQKALADDVKAGRWTKLDQFVQMADQRSLKLILTFADYREAQPASVIPPDIAIVGHFRGRPTILAYDLRNEPHFYDLATSQYPAGSYVALQDAALVPLIGESVARADIADYRASDDGKGIPARLSDDQAYVYANVLNAYLQYLE